MFVESQHVLAYWTSILTLIATVFAPPTMLPRQVDVPQLVTGAPSITVTAPIPGQVIDGDSVFVAWTASDPDGDALVFRVDFSNDDGVIWRAVADNITDSSVEIARARITAGNQARFRVWASDGVNETVDEIDGNVIVVDWPPTVEIAMPAARSFFVVGEPITFTGSAFDIDAGPIGGFALSWSSSIDGFLGRGNSLTVSTLAVGDHTISLRVPDGQGGNVEDSVLIHVTAAHLRFYLPMIAR
ncbi:hypothetical protein GC175_26990 [bacterium]|nr:hypothetical protein [bacterium]